MRRRLLASYVFIALAAVLVLGVPLGVVGARLVRSNAADRVERQAVAVAALVDDRLEAGRAIPEGSVAAVIGPDRAAIIREESGRTFFVGRTPPGSLIRETSPAGSTATVTVIASTDEADERVRAVYLAVVLLSLGGLATAVLLGVVQSRRFARPLEDLARASSQLGSREFSAGAGSHGLPEVDALAEALERDADRIADLLERERAFAANVSHQLRTPLTSLRMQLDEIRLSEDPVAREEAGDALEQVERLVRTVEDLLAHARDGRAGTARPIDAAVVARGRVAAWERAFAAQGRRVVAEGEETLPALAAPGALEQAVDVLVENALRHGAGTARVRPARRAAFAGIAVEDEGAVAAASAEDLFRREEGPRRPGIGLPLARAMIEACGGRLYLASPRPTRFEILLPTRMGDGHGTPVPAEPAPVDSADAG